MAGWDLSCRDWADRLRAARSLVPDLPLDLVQGDRAVAVFNRLRLADVYGTPTNEEAGADWFRDLVRALFGSVDPATRQRRIREFFALVPKKNAKTTNGALLMLTALLLNERPNAPMGLSAPVQDVAQIAFDTVAGAIDLDPVLDKKLHVRHHLKTIVHRETKATLEVMTFDPAALTGPKWAAFMVDELHVVAERQNAARAIRQIRGGMLPYPEAFFGIISTQSEKPPSGVFKAELQRARSIRDGKLAGAMLPLLYEFPEEMQRDPLAWRDPKNWPMVTPNAGRSVTIERLVEEFASAESTGPEELQAWASQHLNVEIGLALSADGWAGALFWEECGDPTLTLEELLRRSEVVTAGIDGGGLDDLLSLTVIGREEGSGDWLHWSHSWMHPVALERRKKNGAVYRDFEKAEELTIVDAVGEDIEQLADRIAEIEATGLLERIGVDQAGIEALVTAIVARDIDRERIVGIPQGWKLVSAINSLGRRLATGSFVHGASGLVGWSVGNAKVEPVGNAVKITKQAAGWAKIDPLMATFDACALMALNPEARKASFSIHHI